MKVDGHSGWKVAVISTDLDLHYLRSTIESKLKDLHFEVVAFELPDYPVQPMVSSHQACLLTLQISDIVVLLIDKRFGGLYLGKGPESITEKEYFEAYKSGKIIVPCVHKKAEQERFNLFNVVAQLMQSDNIRRDEARRKISPKYVTDWGVLDFIEKIRKADRDNFVIYFEDLIDFQDRIEGRLKGLTRFVCHRILRSEVEFVRSVKTSTFALSLGDVLGKGYFVEPPYRVESGEVSSEKTMSQILDLSDKNNRILIRGKPGIGKTTLLAKSFLQHADKCLKEKNRRIPFYLSLRGLGPNYHFSFEKFMEECFQQYLSKDNYPVFENSHIEPVFYIDGFDELAEQSSDMDLQRVVNSRFLNSAFILCSRSRFAEERLESLRFGERIRILIELLQWQKELSWDYIKRFCDLRGNPGLYDDIHRTYHENEEMKNIFENPLLLTMFLFIVEQSRMTLPLDVRDQVSLYDRFIDLWVKRELSRAGRNGLTVTKNYAEKIKRAWQLTAWKIYETRFTGEVITEVQLEETLISFDLGFKEVVSVPAFWDFLDVRPHTAEIKGMFHEQFMEHLLAKEIISSCKEARYPFPKFLEYEIRYGINKSVRTLWQREKREEIKIMFENLWEAYQKYLGNVDTLSIAVRNHVMYYIGRLPNPEVKQKLRLADKMEKQIFVRLSIAFGLVKLEDYDAENELFEKLKNDKIWDEANRGYHLVYYADWILKDEEPPYLDDGAKNWAKTFKALLRHIQSNEIRHIVLRRIELFTIRRFVETRGHPKPLTKNDIEAIGESIKHMEDRPQGFRKKVEGELRELENTFDSIAPSVS